MKIATAKEKRCQDAQRWEYGSKGMYVNRYLIGLLGTFSVLNFQVHAQEDDETGIFVTAETSLTYDDNIFRVIDSLKESDYSLNINPTVSAIGELKKHRFQVGYIGDYTKYSDISSADFSDHEIFARADFSHSTRLNTSLAISYQKEHEEPGGLNRIQLDIDEYNKYDQRYITAAVTYGSLDSIGKIDFSYDNVERDYKNNGLSYLSNNSQQFQGQFTYRIGNHTNVYLSAALTELDYDSSSFVELDNTYKRYQAGVNWDFTDKVSGNIYVGYQERNYDEEQLRDIDGLAYKGNITWMLNTYTHITFNATRESIDSSIQEAGGFLRTSYGAGLSHEITERLKFVTGYDYSNDELVYSSNRVDKRSFYNVGLEYSLLSSLDVAAKYQFEERDSSEELANYKANIIVVSATYFMGK